MENQLLTSPIALSFLTLLCACLLERAWSVEKRFHPLTFFSLVADRMAYKVHLSKSGSPYQQKISGSLAIFMLIAPVITLLLLLVQFAEYPQFFNGVLLYISVYFQPTYDKVKQIGLGVQNNKKVLTRDQASAICLRETQSLTYLGITKASIEVLLLRFTYQVLVPVFLFLFLGGIAAITYRLLYELNQSWNKKQAKFEHFGKPISSVTNVIKWFPVQFALVSISIAGNLTKGMTALVKNLNSSAHQQVYAVGSAALNIELGGPVIYGQKKYRFAKFSGRRPEAADIKRALRLINFAQACALVVICLICAILFAFGSH